MSGEVVPPMSEVQDLLTAKIKKRMTFHVDSFDLDQIFAVAFPTAAWKHGDFNCAKECGNDSTVELSADANPVKDYDAEELAKNLAGERCSGYGDPDILLNEMCRRGLIEPGVYMVGVCW